jgi:hypothetical protein
VNGILSAAGLSITRCGLFLSEPTSAIYRKDLTLAEVRRICSENHVRLIGKGLAEGRSKVSGIPGEIGDRKGSAKSEHDLGKGC